MLGRARSRPRFRPWRDRSGRQPSIVVAGEEHAAQIERLVARAPVRHVHVGAFLDTIEQPLLRSHHLWAVLDGGELVGALQHFRGLSWAAPGHGTLDPRLAEAITRFVDRYGGASEIVFGPERGVDALLERGRSHGWHPVEIRRQELLAVTEGAVSGPAEGPPEGFSLRCATPDDLRWLMEAHAAMCVEDLGQDQVRRHPDSYQRYFRDLIGRRAVFVGEVGGTPLFKAETPLESRQARLVEGVYTCPDARGRGYASWSMIRLSHEAHRDGRRACLYVHRRNAVARRLYRRIGYERICPWSTVKLTSAPRGGGEPVVL